MNIFHNGGVTHNGILGIMNYKVANEFNYFGLVLKYNGKFDQTQKCVYNQGRKVLFGLLKRSSDLM